MSSILRDIGRLLEPTDVRLLDLSSAWVHGVTFVGATLWTDYDLDGDPLLAAMRASEGMNDHDDIYVTHKECVTPLGLAAAHCSARTYLERAFTTSDKPLVVVTHHLPSRRSIDERLPRQRA